MRTPPWLESDITYVRNLAEAGVSGVTSVCNRPGDRAFAPVLSNPVLVSTAIGATIGALSVLLARRRKSGYSPALGSLVGSAIGFGGGVAWASRDFTGAVARSVIRKVNAVRDARWLEKNPINYA
jgi:hypothetical protein